MTTPVPVIDLTDSFTLADHSSLSNVIIILDDTINEEMSPMAINASIDCSVIDQHCVRLTMTHDMRRPKTTRKTAERTHSQRNAQSEQPIRERSPIGNQIGDCPICFDRLGTNPLVSTRCGHVFCKNCLKQALDVERKCPTCRKPLRGNNAYHPLFIGRG